MDKRSGMSGTRSTAAADQGCAARPLHSVAIALVAAMLAGPVSASASYDVVVQNGPSSNRVNIVFLGDGYTASEINAAYTQHINSILSHFFDVGEDPFPRYESFFNVYRVDVVSNESGADVPPDGIFRDTALDASYYFDGTSSRLLYVDNAKATTARDSALAGSGITPHMSLITVNDTRYGGGGGDFAVFPGGNEYAGDLALHELGHSFSGLADEYWDVSQNTTYVGGEPSQVNVTKDPNGQKWSQWLGYVDSLGTVGAYEGAIGYYTYGVYRPTDYSKMRRIDYKFNAVCREKIILDIYGIVDPLDEYLPTSQLLVDPNDVWVDVVDPNVIQVDWYVDDVLVPGAVAESFRLTDYGFGPGLYSVKAKAFDATDWVRVGRQALEQFVTWQVEITPEPACTAVLSVGLVMILRRRRRRRSPLPALSARPRGI